MLSPPKPLESWSKSNQIWCVSYSNKCVFSQKNWDALGQKFNFYKHGHVAYKTEGYGE